ncbi:MAG: ParB/RepB/Spo0J family partition protein [Burkholderiales bacterium]|jgi:ParB family transcriptional regulator, chromosome partitioning protein|nr:ParB/RepB/Spo0J family partition protein [Burkholderiales bacterium]
MSTKSKLLSKTSDLQLPSDDGAVASVLPVAAPNGDAALAAEAGHSTPAQFPAVVPGASPRTGPGQMLQFRGQMMAAEGELAKLREQLKEHEGSLPTRKLDPKLITPSQWANRHPDAFRNAEFEGLKQDIATAGGNDQSILVRPIAGEYERYEIVFGHRRHRACLELGLAVLATIETAPISDLELFSVMDRENRNRADLSPYEQGHIYRRALDAGLYTSNRRLAEALGVSHTWVAKVLQVADLPAPIVECFRTPLAIQHRHAKDIGAALEHDRKAVLRRAEKLRQAPTKMAPGAVLAALLKASDGGPSGRQSIDVDGRAVGTWQRDKTGRLTIQLMPEAVPEDRLEGVLSKLAEALR